MSYLNKNTYFKKTISLISFFTLTSFFMAGCLVSKAETNSTLETPSVNTIVFNENTADILGAGATFKNNTLTISKAGSYTLSGELEAGQIIVDADKNDEVTLVLNNLIVSSDSYAAINCINAKLLTITAMDETLNVLSDGSEYQLQGDNDKTDSAIFTKSDLLLNGTGTINVTANYNDAIAGKGSVTIDSLTLGLDSVDDGITCNEDLTVNSGKLSINAQGDGMRAEETLTINDGVIDILQSKEGLEAPLVTLNSGTITIVSSDDGINASSDVQTDLNIAFNGGTITINANGDGIDSNGNIELNGGEIYISGPTDNGNGTIDYAFDFFLSDGIMIGTGSSGMLQTPSESSTQSSIIAVFGSVHKAGEEIILKDASGAVLASHHPLKEYGSAIISVPNLTQGEKYTLCAGEESISVTIDGTNTFYGTSDGFMNFPSNEMPPNGGHGDFGKMPPK